MNFSRLFKILIITLPIFLSLANFASAVVVKNVYPIPPDVEINPGDRVQVRVTIPRATAELRNPLNVMLVMDRTGSMSETWYGRPKIASAKDSLKIFVDLTDEKFDYVGLVTYAATSYLSNPNRCYQPLDNRCVTLDFPIANMTDGVPPPEPNNKTAIQTSIDSFNASGNTSIGAGMYLANREFLTNLPADRQNIGKYMILATDGLQNTLPNVTDVPLGEGKSILQTAIDNHITVYTVGIGSNVDPVSLTNIANQTGGRYLPGGDPAQLRAAYEAIFREISATQYGFFDWLNSSTWDPSAPFEPITDPNYLRDHLQVREGHCDTWPAGNVITPLDYGVMDPNLGWIIVYLDKFTSNYICVAIDMTIRANAAEGVYNANTLGMIRPIDPFNPCNPVQDRSCWWRIIFGEQIGPGQFRVVSPAKPWLKTTGGDVGSIGNVEFERDLNQPSAGPGGFNTEYLGIGQGRLFQLPNYFFKSAKNWLIQSPNYSSLNIYPPPAPTMYDALSSKYTKRCSATLGGNTPTEVNDAAAGDCHVLVFNDTTTTFAIGGNWANPTPGIIDNNGYYIGKPAIVFVPGQMQINNELKIGSGTGLIFVVGGNIRVNTNVSRSDGIFVTNGEFNTSNQNCDSTGSNNSPLQINGAVYAFGQACFTRNLQNNLTTPAELINFEPKYLWLFRDIIGDPRIIYREVAP